MVMMLPSPKRINRELHRFLPEKLIEQFCRKVGYHFRRRKLTPTLSVHLLVQQLLAKGSLRNLRRVVQLPTLSRQMLAQARARLPLRMLQKLVERFCRRCRRYCQGAADVSLGLRVVLVDGFWGSAPDTPVHRKRYGKPGNQKGPSPGYPMLKLLGLLDYSTGLLHRILALPCDFQEISCLQRMFKHLRKGDLLLGDRGLVSFAHLALLLGQGLHACLRLPKAMVVQQRGHGTHRRRRRLGKQDLLVEWHRGRRPTWMSRQRFAALPEVLVLRQIAFRLVRKGYRPRWVWLITSLTDPALYPAERIIALYLQRWQVEVYFRDLKQSLGMKQFSGKMPATLQKQVLGFVLLYNLVRLTMLHAARRQHVPPQRISFSDAADWLLWSDATMPLPDVEVNPLRRRPAQPRRAKRARKKYPQLSRPRKEQEQPPYVAVL